MDSSFLVNFDIEERMLVWLDAAKPLQAELQYPNSTDVSAKSNLIGFITQDKVNMKLKIETGRTTLRVTYRNLKTISETCSEYKIVAVKPTQSSVPSEQPSTVCTKQPYYRVCADLCNQDAMHASCTAICKKFPEKSYCFERCGYDSSYSHCASTCKSNPSNRYCANYCTHMYNKSSTISSSCKQTCVTYPDLDYCSPFCEQYPTSAECIEICRKNSSRPFCEKVPVANESRAVLQEHGAIVSSLQLQSADADSCLKNPSSSECRHVCENGTTAPWFCDYTTNYSNCSLILYDLYLPHQTKPYYLVDTELYGNVTGTSKMSFDNPYAEVYTLNTTNPFATGIHTYDSSYINATDWSQPTPTAGPTYEEDCNITIPRSNYYAVFATPICVFVAFLALNITAWKSMCSR